MEVITCCLFHITTMHWRIAPKFSRKEGYGDCLGCRLDKKNGACKGFKGVVHTPGHFVRQKVKP